ncbi:MAG TPA: S9 family peptidase [Terrimesophilobacter sp.]|nr:S9 family peptidase [Terrimesophilobacter sp.]
MKTADLPLLHTVSRPTIASDASAAVVAVIRPDLGSDAYVGQLWRVPLAGGAPRRLTRGFRDGAPAFSPDGSLIGFLRAEAKSPPQLFVMAATGGEPVKVTDQKLGVASFEWSPDGTRIAFVARVAEKGRYGTVDELGAGAEPPRSFTTLKYRANGVGFTTDRRAQLFVVEVPDVAGEPTYPVAPSAEDPTPKQPEGVPEAVQLTRGDADHGSPSWLPDGRIAFVAALHESRDDDLFRDVYTVHPAKPEAEPVALTERAFSAQLTHVADDGSLYLLAGDVGEGLDFVGKPFALYRVTDGRAERLTDDSVDLAETDAVCSSGSVVFAHNRTRGSVELVDIAAEGSTRTVFGGEVVVTGHDAIGDTVVATFASPSSSGEVAVIRDGTATVLTDFAAPQRETGIAAAAELTVAARDGYPVHGWVAIPEGEGPHPVILNIHGGPFAAYTVALFDETQVLVDAGYAVVYSNPRGSAGYGGDHGRVIKNRMGTVDMTDVLDFLDGAVAAHPSLDGDRVGIMGGSYGGYLTAWTIAHDHRFAGAIVERGFLDPEGFVGTSDIGMFFGDEYVGTDPELMRSQSPQAVVSQVTTPTLVLHSEEDYRCPLPQAERYFAALRRQGTDAELLVFPGENHELSRSGRPRHRVQRFEAILDWWQRYR